MAYWPEIVFINMHRACFVAVQRNVISRTLNNEKLTYFMRLVSSYTLWQNQKTIRFSDVLKAFRKKSMAYNGLKFIKAKIQKQANLIKVKGGLWVQIHMIPIFNPWLGAWRTEFLYSGSIANVSVSVSR